MSRLIPHTVTSTFGPVTIWGKTGELNDWFPSIAPDILGGGVIKTSTRRGSSVERYPGDQNPFNRSGGAVTAFVEKLQSNNSTPGRRFWLEKTTGSGPLRRRVVRQFTYQGTWAGLRDFARENVNQDAVLRNSSGAWVAISPPSQLP